MPELGTAILSCAIWICSPLALADDAVSARLERELMDGMQQGWTVRVRWREELLVAFVSPPYGDAFELLYQPVRQVEIWRNLCQSIDPEFWVHLPSGSRVVIEPVIGGKGNVSLRYPCNNASE